MTCEYPDGGQTHRPIFRSATDHFGGTPGNNSRFCDTGHVIDRIAFNKNSSGAITGVSNACRAL